ncbi:hypothetical protein ACWQFP_002136, partial [Enterobacter hormaechei]
MSKIENLLDGVIILSIMSAYSLIIKFNPRKLSDRARWRVRIMKKPLFICVVLVMIIASAASLPFVLNAGFGQPPQGAQLS